MSINKVVFKIVFPATLEYNVDKFTIEKSDDKFTVNFFVNRERVVFNVSSGRFIIRSINYRNLMVNNSEVINGEIMVYINSEKSYLFVFTNKNNIVESGISLKKSVVEELKKYTGILSFILENIETVSENELLKLVLGGLEYTFGRKLKQFCDDGNLPIDDQRVFDYLENVLNLDIDLHTKSKVRRNYLYKIFSMVNKNIVEKQYNVMKNDLKLIHNDIILFYSKNQGPMSKVYKFFHEIHSMKLL